MKRRSRSELIRARMTALLQHPGHVSPSSRKGPFVCCSRGPSFAAEPCVITSLHGAIWHQAFTEALYVRPSAYLKDSHI